MARNRVPPPSHRVAGQSGKMDMEWYKQQQRQAREAVSTAADVTAVEADVTSLADDSRGAFIEIVDNKDYTIWQRMPFAGSITRTTTKASTGTCTLTVKINAGAVGGAAHSVTSAEESIARTTSNTFAAGDDLVLTVASNSSCENLAVSVDYTRTL
jgi:hypothetical protein